MSAPTIVNLPSDRHLIALGRLCVTWAVMDRKLTDVVSILIGRGPIVTGAIFPGAENMTPRTEAIKKLLVTEQPGDEEWRTRLLTLVKDIAGRLARRRNRLIHDEWMELEDGLVRIQWNAKVGVDDDGVSQRLHAGRWEGEHPEEIDRFVNEVAEAATRLGMAAICLSQWRNEGQPPEPFWQ